MSISILYAHREDDVTTLLDAIRLQEGAAVRIVIPEKAALFQDVLNVKLLQRECEKNGKKIILATQDSVGISMARKSGITVEIPSEGEKFFEGWEKNKSKSKDKKSKVIEEVSSLNSFSSMSTTLLMRQGPVSMPKRKRGMDIVFQKRPSSTQQSTTSPRALPEGVYPAEKSPSSAPEAGATSVQTPETVVPEKKVASRPKKFTSDAAKADGIVPMTEVGNFPADDAFFPTTPQNEMRRDAVGVKKIYSLPVLVLVIVMAAGAGLFLFVKPSATVTLYPKEETVEFEMDISGRTDISTVQADKAIIPLERLSADDTSAKEFPTSGDRDVVSKAHGRVTVYNTFGTASQAIVATTRFLSEPGGKIFRTPIPITIPGTRSIDGKTAPGSVEIEVVADQSGADFNIPPSRFSIPGFTGSPKEKTFYAVSESPMSGGFTGKTRVVEKKDIEDAKNAFIPSEKVRMEEVLRKKFPPGLRFIDGALAVSASEVTTKPNEGEPGEKFTLSAHTVAEALVFREADVLAILEPNIAVHLASQYVTLSETRNITYTTKQFDSTLGRLVFTVLVSVKTRVVVDEKELTQKMLGMEVGRSKSFFTQQNQIERVDLSLWPFWARHLPEDPAKIKVITGNKEKIIFPTGSVIPQ